MKEKPLLLFLSTPQPEVVELKERTRIGVTIIQEPKLTTFFSLKKYCRSNLNGRAIRKSLNHKFRRKVALSFGYKSAYMKHYSLSPHDQSWCEAGGLKVAREIK